MQQAEHGPYVLAASPATGGLIIERRDGDRQRTVAFVGSVAEWERFVAALEAGANEVAAVDAIAAPATQSQEARYDAPQECAPTVKAADGKTTLRRYRVEAVVYARSRADATRRLEQANIYLDAARVVG